ncbi:DUF4123 domain-containing protein [Vibrio cholerae]|nr:DUF4123 domain-containing protein [Vibrio cholerae]NOF31752.1 DUF4123 domain-containing protein [Vibrio cholerae]TQP38056.1 DUF4123 domain-containing protein [Vibrio cholerae]TQQ19437.1 DUF4123 domain-containing protein [Vibrio cholerae]TQQ38573.1 DUF4123 domain-containing protein [Vibrio cholerae]
MATHYCLVENGMEKMLLQWLSEQTSNVYWLADHSTFKQAVANNSGIVFDGTQVVFHGETFAPVMSLSPWLIPVSDKVLELSDELLQQGIFLTSHSSTSELLSHLQSLLIAALEGEEVLFRFYDRQVILPMLTRMDEIEKNQFLGNISQLVALDSQEQNRLVAFANAPNTQFTVKQTTWWVIKQHHLEDHENLPLVQANLESWLWRYFPKVMNEHLIQGRDIASMLAPFLSVPEQTLTYRVLSAAIVAVVGAEQLTQPSMIELLRDYNNEEAQLALHALTRQFELKG